MLYTHPRKKQVFIFLFFISTILTPLLGQSHDSTLENDSSQSISTHNNTSSDLPLKKRYSKFTKDVNHKLNLVFRKKNHLKLQVIHTLNYKVSEKSEKILDRHHRYLSKVLASYIYTKLDKNKNTRSANQHLSKNWEQKLHYRYCFLHILNLTE